MNRRDFLAGAATCFLVPAADAAASKRPQLPVGVATGWSTPAALDVDYLPWFQARMEDANHEAAIYVLDDRLAKLNGHPGRMSIFLNPRTLEFHSHDPFVCVDSLRQELKRQALYVLQRRSRAWDCRVFRRRPGLEHALVMSVWEPPCVTRLGDEYVCRAKLALGVLAPGVVEPIRVGATS